MNIHNPQTVYRITVTITDELLLSPDGDLALQEILDVVRSRHSKLWFELETPPLGYYREVEVSALYSQPESCTYLRVEYRVRPYEHEGWCHIVVGCIEPNHCTCEASTRVYPLPSTLPPTLQIPTLYAIMGR